MKRIVLPCVVGALILFGTGAFVHIPLQINAQQRDLPAADPLAQLSDRFESAVAKVIPAVVSVEAVKPSKVTAKGKAVEESGSGVIVKCDVKAGYYVITNNHVVR